jgi:Sensors of blue-light using FAD
MCAGITGLMVICDGYVLQAMEGPVEAVDLLYLQIRDDPRHTDVTRLARRRLSTREFPHWSMELIDTSQMLFDRTIDINERMRAVKNALNDPLGERYPMAHFIEVFLNSSLTY